MAIERYWWMRAKVSGEMISAGPRGAAAAAAPRRGRSACAAAEHRPQLALVEACHPRRAQREQQRGGLLPVGVVGGVEHLLGRDEAEEVEDVERAPDRGVEEDARMAGEAAGERRQVGDPAMGDDQLRLEAVD